MASSCNKCTLTAHSYCQPNCRLSPKYLQSPKFSMNVPSSQSHQEIAPTGWKGGSFCLVIVLTLLAPAIVVLEVVLDLALTSGGRLEHPLGPNGPFLSSFLSVAASVTASSLALGLTLRGNQNMTLWSIFISVANFLWIVLLLFLVASLVFGN